MNLSESSSSSNGLTKIPNEIEITSSPVVTTTNTNVTTTVVDDFTTNSTISEDGESGILTFFKYLILLIVLIGVGYGLYLLGIYIKKRFFTKSLVTVPSEIPIVKTNSNVIPEEEQKKSEPSPKPISPKPKEVVVPNDKCSLKQEVYNISSNIYTYEDAKAVCKALGGRLATADEVKDAYYKGADWCNYGWSEGQMVLYPTQKDSWERIQKGPKKDRNSCGRPGVNGGYFENPELRFGVNCFGVKRVPNENEQNTSYDPDFISEEEVRLQQKIDNYKRQLDDINILPFSHNEWAEFHDNTRCKLNKHS